MNGTLESSICLCTQCHGHKYSTTPYWFPKGSLWSWIIMTEIPSNRFIHTVSPKHIFVSISFVKFDCTVFQFIFYIVFPICNIFNMFTYLWNHILNIITMQHTKVDKKRSKIQNEMIGIEMSSPGLRRFSHAALNDGDGFWRSWTTGCWLIVFDQHWWLHICY